MNTKDTPRSIRISAPRFSAGFATPVLLFWWLAWGLVPTLAVADAPVQVIVNPDVRWAATDADASDEGYRSAIPLRAIFGMRLRTWPDGQLIRVFVLGDTNPVHRKFAKTVLSVFPYQLRRVWDQQVYSGIGQAPSLVETEEEMHEAVATTPGAIGYLTKDMVDTRVRVLELE